MVCINSMGRHISLDKIAYIILIKCSLKISEGIKEHKPAISDAVIKSIFLMFKQFDRPDFCDQREYMKVYLYYLKLLVTLGKEVATQGDPQEETNISKPSSHGQPVSNEISSNVGASSEHSKSHFNNHLVFCKVLIMNLHLTQNKSDRYDYFSQINPSYKHITSSKAFQSWIPQWTRSTYSDYTSDQPSHIDQLDKEIEAEYFVKDFDTEIEIEEKIKMNSLKLLMVFVRHNPDLFIETDLQDFIYPKSVLAMSPKATYSHEGFMPYYILRKTLVQQLQPFRKNRNVCILKLQQSLDKHRATGRDELAEVRRSMADGICNNPANKTSILAALLAESKYEIKAVIIETICVVIEMVHRRTHSKAALAIPESRQDKCFADQRQASTNILFILIQELYTTKLASAKLMLEGLIHCPVESMLVYCPNQLAENIVNNFIIPTIAGGMHSGYAYYEELDRFIHAIFDAGFCEYFLSKIEYIKEIIIYNLNYLLKSNNPEICTTPKLKVYFTLVEQLLHGYPELMKDIIPQLVAIYSDKLLTNQSLSQLHYYACNLLCHILQEQRDSVNGLSQLKHGKSWTFEDQVAYKRPRISRCKEEDDARLKRPVGKQPKLEQLKSDYRMLSQLSRLLFVRLIEFARHYQLKDRMESGFVNAFIEVDSQQIATFELYLYLSRQISMEDVLLNVLENLKNKKSRLSLIDYVLSQPQVGLGNLRKQMWGHLFSMFNDKVLSVEIVFTNYNIIYGLRNFQQHMLCEDNLKRLIMHQAQAMKSKNRKLINNSLKSLSTIIQYYSSWSFLTRLQLPVVDYESTGNATEKEKDSGLVNLEKTKSKNELSISQKILALRNIRLDDQPAQQTVDFFEFMRLTFEKFILHGYTRFNVIAIRGIIQCLKRHEHDASFFSMKVNELLVSLLPSICQRMLDMDSFKFIKLSMDFLAFPTTNELILFDQVLDSIKICMNIWKIESQGSCKEIGLKSTVLAAVIPFFMASEQAVSRLLFTEQQITSYKLILKSVQLFVEILKTHLNTLPKARLICLKETVSRILAKSREHKFRQRFSISFYEECLLSDLLSTIEALNDNSSIIIYQENKPQYS